MFKTFTQKFFAIYALITFVVFLLLFGVFTQIVSEHFVSSKYRTMLQEAQSIIASYYDNLETKSLDVQGFRNQLEIMSYHTGNRILITDETGLSLYDSEPSSRSTEGSVIKSTWLDDALSGQIITTIEDATAVVSEPVIMVIHPVSPNLFDTPKVKTTISGPVEGAVIMYAPYPSVKEDIQYVYKITLICFLIILLLTFISTYVFSRNISLTFKAFNHTAKQVARGDFSSRIEPENFSAEVLELADNMNFMVEELEKLEDLRKDFIANISHDFRSPLTSIRGYVQAVMDGTIPPEKYDKYLSIVLSETDRLTKLTNDILLLTKMENEVLKPEREDFDLHETIRKVLMQFEGKIIDKGIELTLLVENQDIIINADYNQVQRIFTNLLDNAIKFCSQGDEIIIETTVELEKVRIAIKDTGPGISEDDIKHIWTRFHKADRSRGKDKKGVGLGLSIVQEILKAHNESIEVYSQLGKGTTFVFTLPIAHQPEE